MTVALLLILLGAFTKSAQVPFHTWLPGAMVAPTPVSTYLHSATMVKAGVYLVARFAPVYALTTEWWRPVVVTVGVATMIVGGARALRRTDLKLLLADGTISQLGFMIAVFGWGTTATTVAGCTMLLAHGAFKATAFMVVGILDHEHGTRDIRHLPRPGAGWAPTVVAAAVAAASMAGVPLLFGFVAKEADYTGFLEQGAGAGTALAVIVVGSALTVAYSVRFLAGATGRLAEDPVVAPDGQRPPWTFIAPALVLSVVTVVLGIAPRLLDALVGAATTSLTGVPLDPHLAVWHGLNTELLLSGVALAAGAVLYVGRRPVDRMLGRRALGALVAGRLSRHARGHQRDRRPRHRVRPARVAADLHRRHPPHRGRRPRRAAAQRASGGRAGRSSWRCRRTSRSPCC